MLRPLKKQMDFELALFLMLNALRAPNKLYLHTKRLKQIRNHWHREDPCLTAVIIGLLVILGLIYGGVAPVYMEGKGSIIACCLWTVIRFVFA